MTGGDRRGGQTYRSQKSLELLVLVEPGRELAAAGVPRLLHLALDLPQPVDLLAEHGQLALLGREVELQVDGGLGVGQVDGWPARPGDTDYWAALQHQATARPSIQTM